MAAAAGARRAPRDVQRVEHRRRVGYGVDGRRRRASLESANHRGKPVGSEGQAHERRGAAADVAGLAQRGDQPAKRGVLRVGSGDGEHRGVRRGPVAEVERVLEEVGP